MTSALLLTTLAALGGAACSDSSAPEPGAEAKASKAVQSGARSPHAVPFDLEKTMRRARLAFRRTPGSTFSGGFGAYRARVSEERVELGLAGKAARGAAPSVQVAFETSGFSCGGGELASPERRGAEVVADGHLALDRGWAVEHLANTEEGLHQSFSFAEAPCAGAFEVRLRVTGASYRGYSAGSGHSFVTDDGRVVSYGDATWRDATGNVVPLAVEHLGEGALRIVVPEEVVARSIFPAEIDPLLTLRIPLNEPVLGFARLDQSMPAISFDGTNYLVIWNDNRAIDENYRRLFATRVTPAGEVLDPGGIPVLENGTAQHPPAIAFDGTNYLVAFVDISGWVRFNRITPAGVPLHGQGGVVIEQALGRDVAVAFDGTNYLVAWPTHTDSSSNIKARLVSASGTFVGASFNVATQVQAQLEPRLLFDGTNYFATWSDRRGGGVAGFDIYGAHISPAGVVLEPNHITIAAGAYDQIKPSVAFDGTRYLVAYQNGTDRPQIESVRVSQAGVVEDAVSQKLSAEPGTHVAPSAAFDGTSFVVVWSSGSAQDVFVNRVSPDGAVLGGAGSALVTASGRKALPTVFCGAAGCLAAWEDGRFGNGSFAGDDDGEVFGTRIADGAALDVGGLHLSRAASEQSMPAIAYRDGNYFVVWQDYREGTRTDLYGARVSEAGTVLDPAGILINSAPYDQREPRLAASESGYFVVWLDGRRSGSNYTRRDVVGARVTPDGQVLDPDGIAISVGGSDKTPAVSSDGSGYLVAWQDTAGGDNDKLEASRIGADGAVLDDPPLLVAQRTGASHVTMAYGEGQYFIVWHTPGTSLLPSGTRGARVLSDGARLDPSPGLSLGTGMFPAVAYDGTSFVVAARRVASSSVSSTTYRMWATRVSPSTGNVLDPSWIQLSATSIAGYSGAWYRQGPELAFDGVDTLIVWPGGITEKKIHGAWLSPAGDVVLGTTLLSSSTGAYHSPTVAAVGDGRSSLVTYVFGDQTTGVQNYRVNANQMDAASQGQECELDIQCKSGHCVDGVCCRTTCSAATDDCFACSVAAGAAVDGICGPTNGNSCGASGICIEGSCDVAGTGVTSTGGAAGSDGTSVTAGAGSSGGSGGESSAGAAGTGGANTGGAGGENGAGGASSASTSATAGAVTSAGAGGESGAGGASTSATAGAVTSAGAGGESGAGGASTSATAGAVTSAGAGGESGAGGASTSATAGAVTSGGAGGASSGAASTGGAGTSAEGASTSGSATTGGSNSSAGGGGASTGGAPPDSSGSGSADADPSDDGGCSCAHIGTTRSSASTSLWLLAPLALGVLRKRRALRAGHRLPSG
ncbi:hypothetical protein WMF11_20405 [Sorangium sp. So ce295]|uniref:hypothetical protein n=1 Tax=Sorangium sp. So ce295 TaxID=3133295 RepID=UPI003F614849